MAGRESAGGSGRAGRPCGPGGRGGLLHAAADLIEGRVGETDHMEVIDHQAGIGQSRGHRRGVGLVGVDHHMADARQPWGRLRRQPVGHRDGAASRENLDEAALVEVDDPGHQHGRVLRGPSEERRLVEPDRAGGAEAGRVIDAGPAVIAHRGHRRVPRHAEVPRGLGDGVLSGTETMSDLRPSPLGQHGPWRDLLGLSDQVRVAHAGSAQRHKRLAHTSTTGRSASGRSPTTTRRRPWPIARTPQDSPRSDPRWSPPRATTRRSPRRAPGRTRRTRRAQAALTHRYRRVPSGASS